MDAHPAKTLQLDELADLVGGILHPLGRVETPTATALTATALTATTLTDAQPPDQAQPGAITMLDRIDRAAVLLGCPATVVLVPQPMPPADGLPPYQIVVDNVHDAMATAIRQLRPPADTTLIPAIDPTATIAPTAVVDASCYVGPHVHIDEGVVIAADCNIHANVSIGPRCTIAAGVTLHPGVVLYADTQIGTRCVLHANVVIGADGFGYKQVEGRHELSSQLGYVVIEDDVEIGACSTVDRGTYGATRIGEGSKLDNQVMIGHNCQIGRHNLLCSQVGIAGSSRTGDHVVLAGQVGIADHVAIADRVIVGAQAGIMADLPADEVYFGSPATPQRDQMQIMATMRRLPEMRRQLKSLQKAVDQLSAGRQTLRVRRVA